MTIAASSSWAASVLAQRANRLAGPTLARPSAAETPARGTPWLRGGDAEGSMEGEAVEIPGRRPSARCAERGGQRLTLDLRRPASVASHGRHTLERCAIGDDGRVALEHEVNACQADR